MTLRLMVLSAFLSSTCLVAPAANQSIGLPLDVDYCQLSKDPSAFIGKRIRIRAIYRFGVEYFTLESPECCPVNGFRMGVGSADTELDGRTKRLYRKFERGLGGMALVVFVGRFDLGAGPFGERFQLTVDKIDNIEHISRYHHREIKPAWLPKNCGLSQGVGDQP